MNIFLWILAIVLAVAFLLAGLTKLTQPKEKLVTSLGWVEDYPIGLTRFIGAAEVLGAIGLILPAAVNVAPILVPIAATCLAVVMVLAAVVHARRKEFPLIGVNLVIAILAVVLAVMRFGGHAF